MENEPLVDIKLIHENFVFLSILQPYTLCLDLGTQKHLYIKSIEQKHTSGQLLNSG